LINLAINARDAMPDGGRLELHAENDEAPSLRTGCSDVLQAGPRVVISVSDSGSGISRENLERIFDPFFTTKEQGKGTGLGLATSLGIVRSYGGDITVLSRLGEGTSFSIYLPAAGEIDASTVQESGDEAPTGNGELILLVDDEPLIVEVARVTLETNGYRVTVAGGGAEAVAYYQRHGETVDAVVLDMMMPGMDGFATMDALRAIKPNVRITASSGLSRPIAKDGRLAAIDGFLPKPYSDAQLLSVVRKMLDREFT
jgi:CheY-like chemotaxis protein